MTELARRKRGVLFRLGRLTLLSVGPVVLAVAGGAYIAANFRYVTTENAYVKADKIAVSTEVDGHVAEVAVRENQIVEPGQLLFRLDEERFRIAVEKSRADLESARHEVRAMQALYRQKSAELRSAREEIAYFNAEFERADSLKKQGHVSGAKYEAVRRDRLLARHRIEAVRQDAQRALAGLGGDPKQAVDAHPMVLAARNAVARAELDLARTAVLAQTRAIVSNIDLQSGEYVELGKPVFSLVNAERFWIEANLKETDLTHLRVGQPAEVTVDAYPDHVWRATVAGIAPATGAEFALLPPQNASGNWVKVVQRVPVRLEIERSADEPALRAGMSVHVKIDTGVELDLPSPLKAALAWVHTPPPRQ